MKPPGFWMHETSGVLRPAVETYLRMEPLTAEHIGALRAYFRQWVEGFDPEADDALHALYRRIDGLTDRASID